MRNKDIKIWLGIIALVGIIAPFSNAANALDNNLLYKKALEATATDKVAFLVSKAEKLNKQKVLQKYANATTLTDGQLVELLKAVGFEGNGLRRACAIAKAESNGRPLAFSNNAKTGDNSFGVFQINMLGQLGPDRREKFDLKSNAELLNPVTNAKVALYMTDGGADWSSWSTLNGKAYKDWYNSYPCIQTAI